MRRIAPIKKTTNTLYNISCLVGVIFIFGAKLCYSEDVVLPEGLAKDVTNEMVKNGGGGGILAGNDGQIKFKTKFQSSLTTRIDMRFWADGVKIADVNYFPSYFMYGFKLESEKGAAWAYVSFTPKFIFPSSTKLRDSESEDLLQPDIPDDLLIAIQSHLKSLVLKDDITWSFTASKTTASVSLYAMETTGSPNLRGVAEYFPDMGFYRRVFTGPSGDVYAARNWTYARWPMHK